MSFSRVHPHDSSYRRRYNEQCIVNKVDKLIVEGRWDSERFPNELEMHCSTVTSLPSHRIADWYGYSGSGPFSVKLPVL